jgi:hypothetical protein
MIPRYSPHTYSFTETAQLEADIPTAKGIPVVIPPRIITGTENDTLEAGSDCDSSDNDEHFASNIWKSIDSIRRDHLEIMQIIRGFCLLHNHPPNPINHS